MKSGGVEEMLAIFAATEVVYLDDAEHELN